MAGNSREDGVKRNEDFFKQKTIKEESLTV